MSAGSKMERTRLFGEMVFSLESFQRAAIWMEFAGMSLDSSAVVEMGRRFEEAEEMEAVAIAVFMMIDSFKGLVARMNCFE